MLAASELENKERGLHRGLPVGSYSLTSKVTLGLDYLVFLRGPIDKYHISLGHLLIFHLQ